jgi:hypothetical protein
MQPSLDSTIVFCPFGEYSECSELGFETYLIEVAVFLTPISVVLKVVWSKLGEGLHVLLLSFAPSDKVIEPIAMATVCARAMLFFVMFEVFFDCFSGVDFDCMFSHRDVEQVLKQACGADLPPVQIGESELPFGTNQIDRTATEFGVAQP